MNDKDYLKENIEKLLSSGQTHLQMPSEDKKRILEVLTGRQAPPKQTGYPSKWRYIMRSRIMKIAAVLAIIGAVLLGLNIISSPGTAHVVWAEVVARVNSIKIFHCRAQTRTSELEKVGISGLELHAYSSLEYGTRMDNYVNGKLASISYISLTKQSVVLLPEQKKYMYLQMNQQQEMPSQQQNDPRDMLEEFMKYDYVELGRDVIDGIEVEGIQVENPALMGDFMEIVIGRLWVEVKTNLPVLLEYECRSKDDSENMTVILDGFEWDVTIENPEEFFTPDIPDDYTQLADLNIEGDNEEGALKGLRQFAELANGHYPTTLNYITAIKEAGEALKNSAPPPQQDEEAIIQMVNKMMSIGSTSAFYTKLVSTDKDARYYGDTVTAEDVEAILLRWQLEDGQYRVIYGDLSTETVSAEQLAQLEAAQENNQ